MTQPRQIIDGDVTYYEHGGGYASAGKYALDIEAPEAQPGSRQAGETHGEVRHGS